jgi:hypothetical protein
MQQIHLHSAYFALDSCFSYSSTLKMKDKFSSFKHQLTFNELQSVISPEMNSSYLPLWEPQISCEISFSELLKPLQFTYTCCVWQWYLIWGTGIHLKVHENVLRNHLNLEPAVIFAFMKIRPRIEVLACQKQAQSNY